MNRTRLVVAALGAAALLWVSAAAQQEVLSRPGPGSGTMNVNVINHPAVTAAQSGEWQVSLARMADVRIANSPTVTIAAPTFLQTGVQYRMTWSRDEADLVTVVDAGSGGWVQVQNAGQRRWVNLNTVRSVEEVRQVR